MLCSSGCTEAFLRDSRTPEQMAEVECISAIDWAASNTNPQAETPKALYERNPGLAGKCPGADVAKVFNCYVKTWAG